MSDEAVFIVVSGPPASGKSTLAPLIATEFGLPLVAKDTIKDALMSVLAVPDVEASRQLGRAAVEAMLAVATESSCGAVLESNFYRSVAVEKLQALQRTGSRWLGRHRSRYELPSRPTQCLRSHQEDTGLLSQAGCLVT